MGTLTSALIVDPTVASKVQDYLTEAESGPEHGGIAGELRVGDVKLDVCASRGWGVQFTRTLPTGEKLSRKLEGVFTVEAAGAVIGELLAA